MDEDRDIRVGLEVFVTETSASDKLRNIFAEKKRQQEEFDRAEAAAYQKSLDAQRKFLADQRRLDAEALAARRQMFGERMSLQNSGVMSLADAATEKRNAQAAFEGVLQLQRQFNAQRLQLEISVQRDIQVLRGRELEMFRAHIQAQVAIARAGYAQMNVMRLPAPSQTLALPGAASAGGGVPLLGYGSVSSQFTGAGGGGFNYGAFANAFWAAFQQRFGNRGGGPPLLGAPPPGGVGGFIPGGGSGLGGFTPSPFNWGAFIQGANLGQNSLNALTGTISNLQMIAVRLAFTGFRVLIAEITGTIGIIYKLSESFLQINEKFAVFQIMLTSILKSATQASDIRSEITRITATSPIPFEGIAELVKSLAIIPGTRQGLIQQAAGGTIQDPNGFLQRSIRLVEQMLTFRPDKKVEDAIFSIREALSGEFRSLVRRFDIPVSAISAYSGVPIGELKKDPQKVLGAMQALFDQLVDPEAVKEAAKQPSKLFQNIWEQIFINPILALGSDTTIKATGKSLYDSILAPFQTLLRQATEFSKNKTQVLPDFSIGELAGSSQLAEFAQKAAEPIFDMFSKTLKFLADSIDKILGTSTNHGQPLIERISQLIVSSLEELNKNFIPMLEKARNVLTGLFELLNKLAMAVAGFLNTFGETIANHPLLSLVGVSAVRGVSTDVIRSVAGGTSAAFASGAMNYTGQTATQYAAAGGAYASGGLAAVGAGASSLITGITSIVLPLILTTAVIAAIWGLVNEYNEGKAFDKSSAAYASRTAGDISGTVIPPYEQAKALNEYAATLQGAGIFRGFTSDNPEAGAEEISRVEELRKQASALYENLKGMGIPADLLNRVQNSADDARALAQELTKSAPDFEAPYNVLLRNESLIRKFQDENSGPPNIFSKTVQTERQFPLASRLSSNQVGFDTFKGVASPEVDAAMTKLIGKENPLDPLVRYQKELSRHLQMVVEQDAAIEKVFGNKSGLQEEFGREAEEVKKGLDFLSSHNASADIIGPYLREYQSLITLTSDGTPLKAATERIKGLQKTFLTTNEGADKNFAVLLTEIEEINKEFTNFSGDPQQAREMADQLKGSLVAFGLDEKKVNTLMQSLTSDVAEKGLKASDREEAAGAVARILKQILEEMVKHLEEAKKAAFDRMQSEAGPLTNQTLLAAPGLFFLNKFAGQGVASISGPSSTPAGAASLGSLLRGEINKSDNAAAAREDANQTREMNKALSSLSQLMSHVENTNRGSAQGAVAAEQFKEDIDILSRRFPDLLNSLSFNVSDLYTNVHKMGGAGLDITLRKLQEAAELSTKLAAKLRAEAEGESDPVKREALLQESRRLQMQGAQYQDRYTDLRPDSDPFHSFAAGFYKQTSMAQGAFTDLTKAGEDSARAIETAFDGAFASFIDGTKSANAALHDFLRNMLLGIANAMAQSSTKSFIGLFGNLLSGYVNSTVNTGGGTWSSDVGGGRGFAEGGMISGGSGIRDDVHVIAMGGEFVLNKNATQRIGRSRLESWNQGMRGYDDGGYISPNSGPGSFDRGSNVFRDYPGYGGPSGGPIVQVYTAAPGSGSVPGWWVNNTSGSSGAGSSPSPSPSSSGSLAAGSVGGGAGSSPHGPDYIGYGTSSMSAAANYLMWTQSLHQPTNLVQPDSPNRFYSGVWQMSENGLERVGERTDAIGRHANGGPISGGSGFKDDVHILAMGGEFIVNRKGVEALGTDFLNNANSGMIDTPHRFESGGYVTPSQLATPSHPQHYGGNSGSETTVINIPVTMTSDPGSKKSPAEIERDRQQLADNLRAAVIEELENSRRIGGRYR